MDETLTQGMRRAPKVDITSHGSAQLSSTPLVYITETSPDRDQIRDCLRGDLGAFERIVEKYERPLFHAASRLVGNAEDARDIVQTAFTKAFEKLSTYDDRHDFRSWIYRIAINEAINFRKRRHRLQPVEDLDATVSSSQDGPEIECSTKEVSRHIQVALMSLNRDHRAVIVLRHYLECSYEEIAEVLGIREKTVKSRLFSARVVLKESLIRRGVIR